jgi:hypothetical protein
MTEEDQALAGIEGAPVPEDLNRDMLRLRLIAEARGRNVPWAVIGASLGMDGKQAKAMTKRLARDTRRQLITTTPDG